MFLGSVTLTSTQHLEKVEASQECPQFAKNVLTLKVQTQIGSHEDRKHTPCVPSCGPVSGSDSTVCSCNTMAHYLEPSD